MAEFAESSISFTESSPQSFGFVVFYFALYPLLHYPTSVLVLCALDPLRIYTDFLSAGRYR